MVKEIEQIKGEYNLRETYITALGRDSSSTKEDNFGDLNKAYQDVVNNSFKEREVSLKENESARKDLLSTEQRKIEAEKLKQKNEEIRLKREQLNVQKFTSIINKN